PPPFDGSIGPRMRRGSGFVGVSLKPGKAIHPWVAYVDLPKGRLVLGHWKTKQAAALAHDRAVAQYAPGRRMNFAGKRIKPADAATVRAEARSLRKAKMTSKFRGVASKRGRGQWAASIAYRSRQFRLGAWKTEREAAEAYDRAPRYLLGRKAQLNFPDRTLAA